MAVDTFIVTDIGLAAALDAAEHGIKLVLATFRIGSASGYTPTRADTALHGSVLYTDQITNFRISSDGSLVATCTIAVDAGPFTFGEVGIYTQAGQLFALAALAQPATKYSSLGTNIASTYSFDVFIRLGQSTSVIEIDSVTTVTYAQIVSALGFTPYNSANPSNYLNAASLPAATSSLDLQFHSIGVGTAPSNILGSVTAVGNIYTTGNLQGWQTSDPKFKENPKQIDNPLAIIRCIGGYEFDWTDEYLAAQDDQIRTFHPKHDTGMLANEVHQHWPLAGRTRGDGTLTVVPDRMIPLLLAGLRQLDNKVREQDNVIQSLKEEIGELKIMAVKKLGCGS